MMSKEAKKLIAKLLEIDSRRRYRASDLMKEPWIKCTDMPLTIFETAGSLFRANSVDRTAHSNSRTANRSERLADGFNQSIANLHKGAIEHLRTLGFTGRAIEESLRQGTPSGCGEMAQIYKGYQDHINNHLATTH